MKPLRYLLCAIVVLAMAAICTGSASAALLGVQLDYPRITFDSLNTPVPNNGTSFDPGTGVFRVTALPVVYSWASRKTTPVTGNLSLNLQVQLDSSGAVVPGQQGDQLVITGDVLPSSTYTGPAYTGATLLTGKITRFGYLYGGATNVYDFRFTPTGGALFDVFKRSDIGVTLTSENSTFTGSFNASFHGNAKGTVGIMPGPHMELTGTCTDAFGQGAIEFSATLSNTGTEALTGIACSYSPSTTLSGVPSDLPLNGTPATITGSYLPDGSPSTGTLTCSATGTGSQVTIIQTNSTTCKIILPPGTSCVAITAVKGVALTPVTLTASGGLGGPYAFSAIGLPAGVTLSSGGTISGTPLESGTFSYTVTVQDSAGNTGSTNCSLTVNPPPSTTCAGITAVKGVAITPVTLTASGGVGGPYTFSATGLPAGISISSGGTISGTPTASGSFGYTVTVTDAAGNTGSADCSVSVNPPPSTTCVGITAVKGVAITPVTLTASGGVGGPYTFSATGLPAGISISSGGTISGTPTASGSFSYAVTVTDAAGNTGSADCSITVNPPPSTNCVGITAVKGVALTPVTLTASGGLGGPYTFSATGLPAGISISSGGTISGTPTASGSFSYTVTVTDAAGNTGSSDCSVTVNPPPSTTCIGITAVKGVALTPVTMTASGGVGVPYTFSATGLPAGITMSSAGTISGTPTVSGTFSYTVTVTDAAGNTGSSNCSVTVNPPPSTCCVAITAIQGVPIMPVTMTASGGVGGPYTFSATGLPAGLTMSSAGTISGTPTVSGTFNYTVTVTDAAGNTGSSNCSVTVNRQTSGCTYTYGYWKTHCTWPVGSLRLGTTTYSKTDLNKILQTAVKGNGLISLAHQLIAAKLNTANGASVTPEVQNAINAADLLIGSLVIPPIGTGYLQPGVTSATETILDNYNNGLAAGGPAHCGDLPPTPPPPPPVCTGAIGDLVWNDGNANGYQDSPIGIPGVKITLYDVDSGKTYSTTTDAYGKYRFTGLCSGAYVVTAATPSGWKVSPSLQGSDRSKDSNGSPANVTLATNTSVDLTVDFGFYQCAANSCTGSIGNFVWNDLNRNGIQDAGEPGLVGVTLTLTGAGKTLTTVTDANGKYTFSGLCAGTYTVSVSTPTAFTASPTAQGCDPSKDSNGSPTASVTLSSNSTSNQTVDFGFYKNPTVTQGTACSPGYWKNHTSNWQFPYRSSDDFDKDFGTNAFSPEISMLDALRRTGGGLSSLVRQAAAALLNAQDTRVDYPLSVDQVKTAVKNAIASGQYQELTSLLDHYNNLGCPLN